jgi:hypothetical protein
VLRCLTQKKDEIKSEACRKEVFYFEKMEVSNYHNDVILAAQCRADVDKICKDVPPGEPFFFFSLSAFVFSISYSPGAANAGGCCMLCLCSGCSILPTWSGQVHITVRCMCYCMLSPGSLPLGQHSTQDVALTPAVDLVQRPVMAQIGQAAVVC